eukprot:gnl/TRDRNA2_/TRDRNA2_160385_c0_seq1.p1 gnl/TRDRNA2_/TRDRNA2_160385_c0~~gnl/TRDRNA2_/TRDRNA2_160385_c0_seq1.p1  ORF type:complete len:100 (+),score=3.40 gnl/TRDRNA2_/TRDRNA2_160385_c0_seq1:3-302(+)
MFECQRWRPTVEVRVHHIVNLMLGSHLLDLGCCISGDDCPGPPVVQVPREMCNSAFSGTDFYRQFRCSRMSLLKDSSWQARIYDVRLVCNLRREHRATT